MLSKMSVQTKAEEAWELVDTLGWKKSDAAKFVCQGTDINVETVRKKLSKKHVPKMRDHGNNMLTDVQEASLVGIIQARSSVSRPMSKKEIISLVRRAYKKDDKWHGYSWLEGFLKRNNTHIGEINPKETTSISDDKVTMADCRRYIKSLSSYFNKFQYLPDLVINADETPSDFLGNTKLKYVGDLKKKKHNKVKIKTQVLVTVLPFVAASGKVWAILYIFKDPKKTNKDKELKINVPKLVTTTRCRYERYYATSSKGYMNSILWRNMMVELNSLIRIFYPEKRTLLLCDHFGGHHDEESVNFLHQCNIDVVFVPVNSTLCHQPLDTVINAVFKAAVSKLKEEKMISLLPASDQSNELNEIVYEAEGVALTKTVIQLGFELTGIHPLDIDLILDTSKRYFGPTRKFQKMNSKDLIITEARQAIERVLKPKKNSSRVIQKRLLSENRATHGKDLLRIKQKNHKIKENRTKKRQKAKEEVISNKRKRDEKKLASTEERKKRKVELENQKKEQKKLREKNKCLVCGASRTISNKWISCSHCKHYKLCPTHKKSVEILDDHIKNCKD